MRGALLIERKRPQPPTHAASQHSSATTAQQALAAAVAATAAHRASKLSARTAASGHPPSQKTPQPPEVRGRLSLPWLAATMAPEERLAVITARVAELEARLTPSQVWEARAGSTILRC